MSKSEIERKIPRDTKDASIVCFISCVIASVTVIV